MGDECVNADVMVVFIRDHAVCTQLDRRNMRPRKEESKVLTLNNLSVLMDLSLGKFYLCTVRITVHV